jgi:hypothetical protein
MFNALALSLDLKSPTINIHRCLHGLQGYLILFDPHAFVPQRQYILASCLRIWSLRKIYAFYNYLMNTANLIYTLV